MNTRLRYEYTTVCILDFSEEELRASVNPFAWILLLAKQALLKGKAVDERLLEGKLFIFRKLFENGLFEKPKVRAILTFLANYVQFAEPETNRIFNAEIDKMSDKFSALMMDGIFARKVGRKEATEKIVRRVLSNSKFSVEKIASMLGVSVTYVKKLSKEVRTK